MNYKLNIKTNDQPSGQNKLFINFPNKHIKATLSTYIFEDHGFMIYYIPSLNLSAYGDSVEEAKAMMVDTVLPDLLTDMIIKPRFEVFEHLGKLGWLAIDRASEKFENTAYVDKEGILRNFDLPIDTPIEETLLTV